MLQGAYAGHTAAVDLVELRKLLGVVANDLKTIQPRGTPAIDIDEVRQAVAQLVQGLSAPSWEAVDPSTFDAMKRFLSGIRSDRM